MSRLILTIALFGILLNDANGQTVQAGIFNPMDNLIVVRAKTSQNFAGVLNATSVTIRWFTNTQITIDSLESIYPFRITDSTCHAGYTYVTFCAAPAVPPSLYWNEDHELKLFAFHGHGPMGSYVIELSEGSGWTPFQFVVDGNDIANTVTPFYQSYTDLIILPIQLQSLTAHVNAQQHVELDWFTISEIDNYGFYVQRSFNTIDNYTDVLNSFVAGHGTTLEMQYYSYVDSTATPGTWFYRLKQIDLDGTIHFTDGIQVDVLTDVPAITKPNQFDLSQNYPNPFNPTTRIKYSVTEAGRVSLKVFNMLGQEVATLVDGNVAPGSYQANFDASKVASGVYIYKMTSGSRVESRKMLLQK